MTYDLAPCAVVRAPLWPVDRLDALAAPDLAAAARSDLPDEPFAALHTEAMTRQQEALWRVTLGDARFAAALALDNPAAFGRLQSWRPAPRRDKRARQAEQTLYRYLGRATWRPSPAGLWAGAGLAAWGDRDACRPLAHRLTFAPDLGGFASAFLDLARDSAAPVKLNPTLTRRGERWLYLRRTARGFSAHLIAAEPALDAAIDALSGKPVPWDEAVRRVAAAGLEDAATRCRAWLAAGVLFGGPTFPRRFATVWQALALAGSQLDGTAHQAWRAAVDEAHRLCSTLEDQTPTAADLLDAGERLTVILQRLGVDGTTRLRCDSGLPFAVTFGPEQRERLAAALAEADTTLAAHGLTAFAEHLHMRRRLTGEGVSPTTARAWQDLLAEGDGPRRVRLWQDCLDNGRALPAAGIDAAMGRGPFGMLALRLGDDSLTVAGLGSDLTPAFARLGALFGDAAAPLTDWCGRLLRHAADGVTPCELMPPPGLVHNGLARPAIDGLTVLDPWGAEPDQAAAEDLSVGWDEDQDCPTVADAAGSRMRVFSLSPLDLGAGDPLAERLLFSGGRSLPPWLNDDITPLASDLRRDGPAPALRLESGTVVRSAKLFVTGESWRSLLAAAPAQRFRLWQRLAHRHGLPAVVGLTVPGQPQMPIPRDSPLALEAALRGAAGDLLVVTLPDDRPFLTDADGHRHVGELALPFHRRPLPCPAEC